MSDINTHPTEFPPYLTCETTLIPVPCFSANYRSLHQGKASRPTLIAQHCTCTRALEELPVRPFRFQSKGEDEDDGRHGNLPDEAAVHGDVRPAK